MLYSWCIWQMLCSWCYSTSAIQREGIWQVPYRGGYLTSAIHGEGIWQVLDRGGVFDKCFTRQIFVSCNTGKGIWLAQKKESRTKERKGKQRKGRKGAETKIREESNSETLLDPFWSHLGPCRPSWAYFGTLLGQFGDILGNLRPSWAILKPSWSHLGPFCGHLGPS